MEQVEKFIENNFSKQYTDLRYNKKWNRIGIEFVKREYFSNIPYTNCIIIGDDITGEVAVIDPVGNAKSIQARVDFYNAKIAAIIYTHFHFDHTGATDPLLENNKKALICYNERDCMDTNKITADINLREHEPLRIGNLILNVLYTGGHCPENISLYTNQIKSYKDKEYDGVMSLGDTCNLKGNARIDLDYSDSLLLNQNISEKILSNYYITPNFLLIPGHGRCFTQKELIQTIVPQELITSFMENLHSLSLQ